VKPIVDVSTAAIQTPRVLKARQRLGKYRVEKKIGEGGFAMVYRAYDTIEGIPVALKVPHWRHFKPDLVRALRQEVRMSAGLDHPNILPIKNAEFIDKTFVIVYPLGDGTLADRMRKRLSTRTALDFAEQMLSALAYAHKHRVIHCDIKPDNFILFPNATLRLADFGIAKFAQNRKSVRAEGTGTVGYIAPEQAFGKPSLRSDVFALGLVFYRMFTGHLPEWPYEWPPPGFDRLKVAVPGDFQKFLKKALWVDQHKRFADGNQMFAAFKRLKPTARRHATTRAKKRAAKVTAPTDWRTLKIKQFRREHGKELALKAVCRRCAGPMSEPMLHCPWCGDHKKVYQGESSFPQRCGRCGRGQKLDWRFCAWCYGGKLEPETNREYTDVRYEARCSNSKCTRKELMPFMRYCPWCRTKVRKSWPILGSRDKCSRCHNGVVHEYWDYCPWCGKSQRGH
jgi:serine/threonine protein kinase